MSATVGMMRVIVLLLFVGALAITPCVLFERYALPDLAGLKAVYGNAEELTKIDTVSNR